MLDMACPRLSIATYNWFMIWSWNVLEILVKKRNSNVGFSLLLDLSHRFTRAWTVMHVSSPSLLYMYFVLVLLAVFATDMIFVQLFFSILFVPFVNLALFCLYSLSFQLAADWFYKWWYRLKCGIWQDLLRQDSNSWPWNQIIAWIGLALQFPII